MNGSPQGRKTSVWVFVAAFAGVAVVAGMLGWFVANSMSVPVVPAPAPTVTTPTVEASTTVPAETSPTVTATATVEPTSTPEPGLGYTPGPDESGTNFAYLKKAILKGGHVYITVDYIVIGEGPDGWFITNDNPKLRTFPLLKTCPCRYLVEGGATLSSPLSPVAFLNKWKAATTSKMIRKNPYKVTVKHGVVTKLDNEWLP
ncbi:MAG TPA: hypothetical protein VIJ45_02015, partial [Coriobacteriia bacterium]